MNDGFDDTLARKMCGVNIIMLTYNLILASGLTSGPSKWQIFIQMANLYSEYLYLHNFTTCENLELHFKYIRNYLRRYYVMW